MRHARSLWPVEQALRHAAPGSQSLDTERTAPRSRSGIVATAQEGHDRFAPLSTPLKEDLVAASNAAMTAWQDVTPRSRAVPRGAQAVANVRRAAHTHSFSVDGTDWAVLARVYQRAVGATPWWRLMTALTVLLAGWTVWLTALQGLSGYTARHPILTGCVCPQFAPGILGVVEAVVFVIALAVVWAACMFGPAALLCACTKRVARKTPAWTARPVPPALAVAETCGAFLAAPGDEQESLLERLDQQLEMLLSTLLRAAVPDHRHSSCHVACHTTT